MHNQSERRSLSVTINQITEEALDQLFREARSHSAWLPEPVSVALLRKAYELARLGPTSGNASPARFIFLTTPDAKARLKPVLMPGNVDKTMAAPTRHVKTRTIFFFTTLRRHMRRHHKRARFDANILAD
jgi:3-hydroxypropanoate dehydrogenase